MYLVYALVADLFLILGCIVIVLSEKQMHLWIVSYVVQLFLSRPIFLRALFIWFSVLRIIPAVGDVPYKQEWRYHYGVFE